VSLALSRLTDDELIAKIEALSGAERTATAALIALLAELEARRLHLAYGFKSLFGYCRHVLHCSEAEAFNRMVVVHAARRFPVILPMLAEGLLHLTAVRLLAPHLKDEDHLPLLGGAIHKSRREIVKLLACWFPSRDVESSVRRLPAGRHVASEQPASTAAPEPPAPRTAPPPPARTAAVAPLSVDRYRLQVTIEVGAVGVLGAVGGVVGGGIPRGGRAAVVARALKGLRREAGGRACGAPSRRGPAREPAAATRDIPAHVERAVWQRDQGQCSFEGRSRRCEERSFLEYHHLTPWIVGGAPSVENIALRCSAHNKYEADVYFAPIRAAREARESALVPGPVP
jgi:hypothetical protein